MVSGTECATEPVAPSSRRGGTGAGSGSLPNYSSLRSPRDFRTVLRGGKRITARGMVLLRHQTGDGLPRLGLVVPKSAGNAVRRNRIKRRLRHAAATLDLQPGNDYVIIATSQTGEMPYGDLVDRLRRALAKSHA